VLGAFLLTGLFAAPLSSVAMFVPGVFALRVSGRVAFSRRLASALLGSVLLAGTSAALAVAVGARPAHAVVAGTVLAVFSALLLPATRRWNGRAHVCWAACTYLYIAYLAFIIVWTFDSGLGVTGTVGGVVLWLLELLAGLFAGAYLWELCDVLGTEEWRRRVVRPKPAVSAADHTPFVSLHVPAHNEPPDMVIETLAALTRIDYPHYEIVCIDDNTDDPELWRPVEAWCQSHDVKFAHLENWPGFKSGALNFALEQLTDPRAEVIGVVDSDYQITPGFLRACAPLFADPSVGFIQAPQDYRDWEQAGYYRRLYYSYKYFFAVSQPSRNERDAAIFAGTMGLIRKDTLADLGGWDEWCITEDAELSLRLLRAGWSGLHVDQSFGHGVMPLTFEALKSQRYRWCFGGIQILRMYWRDLLPSRKNDGNRLTLGQRWGYLAGGMQWYGDLLGLLFYVFLLVGAVNLALGGGKLFRTLTGFLVAAVPVLVVLGLLRAVALVRRGTGARWREAFGAFFIWQATSLVVARASVQGLFAKKAVFLRTPKTFDRADWWQVVRANWAESTLAGLGLLGIAGALFHAGTLSGILLAVLLLVPTLGYGAAPFNSLAAQRAALPPDLSRRRATEFLRSPAVTKGALGFGGLAAAAGVAALVVALVSAGREPARTPHVVADPPHRKTHSPSAPTGPSSGPSASSSPATPPSGTGTSTPAESPGSPTPAPASADRTPSGSPSPTTSAPASSAPSSTPSTSSPVGSATVPTPAPTSTPPQSRTPAAATSSPTPTPTSPSTSTTPEGATTSVSPSP